jgi:hypothetical protein
MAGKIFVMIDRFHSHLDRPATLMTQNHDQRCIQYDNRILDGGDVIVGQIISGAARHEQITQRFVKTMLGTDSGI